jgi:hypothetical protein
MFVVPMMCMISSRVSSFPLAELVEWCTLEKNVQLVNVILEFLMSIGYGANKIATHVISVLHNTQKMMLERFDYLLERGAEYKMLCQIVSVFPKILIHVKEMLNEKLNYTSLWSWSWDTLSSILIASQHYYALIWRTGSSLGCNASVDPSMVFLKDH